MNHMNFDGVQFKLILFTIFYEMTMASFDFFYFQFFIKLLTI